MKKLILIVCYLSFCLISLISCKKEREYKLSYSVNGTDSYMIEYYINGDVHILKKEGGGHWGWSRISSGDNVIGITISTTSNNETLLSGEVRFNDMLYDKESKSGRDFTLFLTGPIPPED